MICDYFCRWRHIYYHVVLMVAIFFEHYGDDDGEEYN